MAAADEGFQRVPFADRCDECGLLNRAAVLLRHGDGKFDALYACPCGVTWSCGWMPGAGYEEGEAA